MRTAFGCLLLLLFAAFLAAIGWFLAGSTGALIAAAVAVIIVFWASVRTQISGKT